MADCSDVSIGKRIKKLRNNYKQNGKRLSQADFAKKLGYSREQVAKWETGKQPLKPDELAAISSFFKVSIDKLIIDVDSNNRSIAEIIGLSDESIEYLKNINTNRDISFEDAIFDEDFAGYVASEGYSNLLILKTLNLILSTECGENLLSAIGSFCFGDFSKGYPVFVDEIEKTSSEVKESPIDSIRLNVSGIREGCNVSLDLMKYALLKSIENEISTLRVNAMGDE